MTRFSESIASLAAALAKAQAELVNPEKSLLGTIEADGSNGARRSFRYAPLASGLDIVRKTLGQHEIAIVQTTAIDHDVINLTTVLAHASGEWIASDWPVCGISATATPHRLGTALTYARRYALFTLVGIAGEDDLDAPDLPTNQTSMPEEPGTEKLPGKGNGRLQGGQSNPPQRAAVRNRQIHSNSAPMLGAEASAQLCDRLLAEVNDLGGSDEAADWAQRRLIEKNRLTAADAQRVEAAFAARLATFATAASEAPAGHQRAAPPPSAAANQRSKRRRSSDKSLLPLPEPRRLRDREHVKFVAKQPCLICGRTPCDAHHLRFAQQPALGRKVSDEFTVPLCRGHHRELHRRGHEGDWWRKVGIDPTVQARVLWLQTHPLPRSSDQIDREQPSPSR